MERKCINKATVERKSIEARGDIVYNRQGFAFAINDHLYYDIYLLDKI
jgi:hypothetical protein